MCNRLKENEKLRDAKTALYRRLKDSQEIYRIAEGRTGDLKPLQVALASYNVSIKKWCEFEKGRN